MFFKNKLLPSFLLILLTGILYFYNNNNNNKIYFKIKTITIDSKIINADKKYIFEYAEKYLDKKSFFNFNINILKKELEKIEWIKSVNVRRVYPNEVKLSIEEHRPVAIWNNINYLNDSGKMFFVNKISKDLPRLNSNYNRSDVLFEYFSLFSTNLLKNKINAKIVEINENDIKSLSILLSSDISVKFGSKDVRNKIIMFFKIYKALNARLNTSDLKKIRYIDMRYSNGFSIGWK